jgi:HlyD family secretion protein
MKKFLIIVLIIVVIGAAGYFGYQNYQQKKAAEAFSNLQTTPAEIGSLTATVGATGIVHSNQSSVLRWQTYGTVEKINGEVGDQVAKGDILATLEKTSLPQNVIMAEAELVNAKKALDDLYTNAKIAKTESLKAIATYTKMVRDAKYQLDNFTVPTNQADLSTTEALELMEKKLDEAREAFEPYKHLSSSNETRQDLKEALDEAQADYNAAVKRLEYETNLEVAQNNLDKARQDFEKYKDGPAPDDIAAAEARIAAAEATIKTSWIEAPFDGTITQAVPKPGDQVAPNALAFQLDDLSHLLVDVEVSEVDINRVEVGQKALLTFDAILGKEYQGKVTAVAPVGTSNQGVVDFNVTVEILDADEDVKPGMTSAVNIVVDQLDSVLLVPNRAVRLKEGKRVVYILDDGQVKTVEITLGATSDTVSEVIDGDLKVGDQIILNPPMDFSSGGHPPFMER